MCISTRGFFCPLCSCFGSVTVRSNHSVSCVFVPDRPVRAVQNYQKGNAVDAELFCQLLLDCAVSKRHSNPRHRFVVLSERVLVTVAGDEIDFQRTRIFLVQLLVELC